MAKVINTKIDDGILIFTFTNNEDEIFSSFKLNPTDINVAARAEELTEYFEQLKDTIQNGDCINVWTVKLDVIRTIWRHGLQLLNASDGMLMSALTLPYV